MKPPISFFRFLSVSAAVGGLILRIIPLTYGNFWFAFDTARDYLWVRDIVIFHKPYLIGPWASLTGVFYGPLWFYLLSLMYYPFAGNPVGGAVLISLSIALTALIAYFFCEKDLQSPETGVFACLFLSFSSLLIQMGTVPFFANFIPIITLVIIICLFRLTKRPRIYLPFLAFLIALCFHFEPVYGFVAGVGSIVYLWTQRSRLKLNIVHLLIILIFFCIPFFPQILFELRHNFLQTRAVALYFQGKNHSLEGALPFNQRVIDRLHLFATVWRKTFSDQWSFAGFLMGLVFIFIVVRKDQNSSLDKSFELAGLLFLFTLGMYLFLLIFREEAKEWYVTGLPVVYSLLLALTVVWLLENTRNKTLIATFLVFSYLVMNTSGWIETLLNPKKRIILDASIFVNQLKVVDDVYQNADNNGFSVYTYTPGVYDYPYQYIFWWYGAKKYGYLPEDLAYLPNKPVEYVPNKKKYEAMFPKRAANWFYLIVEKEPLYPQRLSSWYSTFENTSYPVDRTTYPTGVFVEKRMKFL